MNHTIVKKELSNGQIENYKVVNGTYFKEETNDKVIDLLEDARLNNSRIRIFYGDTSTGKSWLDEYDVLGYIGRSTGETKIPLLISTRSSFGGSALLDSCIVKITKDKRTIYEHPKFHIGNVEIKDADSDIVKKGYLFSVFVDSKLHANFRSKERAENWVEFMKGTRNKAY